MASFKNIHHFASGRKSALLNQSVEVTILFRAHKEN